MMDLFGLEILFISDSKNSVYACVCLIADINPKSIFYSPRKQLAQT